MLGILKQLSSPNENALDRERTVFDIARDAFAVLAPVSLSIGITLLILLLWKGGWSPRTEELRLWGIIATLIGFVLFLGLGCSWLWKMQFDNFHVKAGLLEAGFQTDLDGTPTTAPPWPSGQGQFPGGGYGNPFPGHFPGGMNPGQWPGSPYGNGGTTIINTGEAGAEVPFDPANPQGPGVPGAPPAGNN